MFDGEHYLRFFHPAQQNITQQLSLYIECAVYFFIQRLKNCCSEVFNLAGFFLLLLNLEKGSKNIFIKKCVCYSLPI